MLWLFRGNYNICSLYRAQQKENLISSCLLLSYIKQCSDSSEIITQPSIIFTSSIILFHACMYVFFFQFCPIFLVLNAGNGAFTYFPSAHLTSFAPGGGGDHVTWWLSTPSFFDFPPCWCDISQFHVKYEKGSAG